MQRLLVLSISLLVLVPGCGDDSDAGADAATPFDAFVLDAPSIDAPATDAPTTDASAEDAGLDCEVVGCGQPVVCGEACEEPCGCCLCAEGEEIERGGAAYVCTSAGCYEPRGGGGAGDPCESTEDCGTGFSCCYPCGIPGCENVCEPTCDESEPACAGGCLLRP